MRPWKVTARRTLVDTVWMRVYEERIELPNGATLDPFFGFEVPSWVMVLCLDEAGRVVMVEQYRHGVGRASLELPAGNLEPGETPLEGARRELAEETGYGGEDWVSLGQLHAEPPRSPTAGHVFGLRGARPIHPRTPDLTEEELVLHTLSLDQLTREIVEGRVFHGVHLGAIMLARSKGFAEF